MTWLLNYNKNQNLEDDKKHPKTTKQITINDYSEHDKEKTSSPYKSSRQYYPKGFNLEQHQAQDTIKLLLKIIDPK